MAEHAARRRSRVVTAALWIALAPFIGTALVRIADVETTRLIAIVEAATLLVYLPVYAVLVASALLRRRMVALVAVVLVALHFAWAGPEIFTDTRAPSESDGRIISIYSHNLRYDNQSPEAVVEAVRSIDADVVVFQEFSYAALELLRDSGVLSSYPYEFLHPFNAPQGLGVFSKLALSESSVVENPGFPALRTVVDAGTERVVLYNVHVQSPVQDDIEFWKGDLAAVRTKLGNEDRPVIAAGDFNATYGNREFRRLLDAGLREAHIEAGRGLARTWPMTSALGRSTGGWLRLDHVLVSDGIGVRSVGERPALGSDHKGVVVEVVIPRG